MSVTALEIASVPGGPVRGATPSDAPLAFALGRNLNDPRIAPFTTARNFYG